MKFLVLAALIATCSAASINVGLRGRYVAGIGGNIGSGYIAGIGGTGYSGLTTGYLGQLNKGTVLEPIVAAARAGHLSSHGAATPIAVAAPLVAPAPSVVYSSAGLATGYSGPIHQNTLINAFSNGAAIAALAPIAVAAQVVAAAPSVVAAPVVYSGALNSNTQLTSFPNGAVVPVDEPAVAAARADHLAKKGVNAAAVPAAYAAPGVYSGALNLSTELRSFPNGAVVPADEPAVATARAAHLAKKGVNAAAAPAAYAAPVAYSGALNLNTELTSFPNGAVVPVDEPAVAAARADHLAKKGTIAASAPASYAVPNVYSGALNLNTELRSFPNGAVVPADEPAVAAARTAHLAKKGVNAAAAPAAYAAPGVYSGALNLNTELTSFPNGAVVPVDEPAVAAARADHLAKKGAITASAPASYVAPGVYSGALNLNTGLTSYPNGAVVPVDEPAVAAARADHLAKKGINVAAAPAAYTAPVAYSGALNLNTELTSFPNGAVVPVDEPAVAAARADHLANKGAIEVSAPASYAVPNVYSGALNLNTELTSFPNGAVVPVDEPAVAAARADHLAKKGVNVAAAPAAYATPVAYSGALNLNTELTSFPNGAVVPVDEPAVAAARADHLAKKGAIEVSAPASYAVPNVYSGALNLNTELTTFPNGAVVPVDEPAVAAARADHLAKKGVNVAAAPAAYTAPGAYSGLLNLYTGLTSFPNGAVVPVDEPAVAAARADHLAKKGLNVAAAPAAYAAPIAYSGTLNLNTGLTSFPNGAVVPVNEPAVAAARAEHLAKKGGNVAAGYGAGYAPYAGLVAHPNGAVVPVDEPAVSAARAEHLGVLGAI